MQTQLNETSTSEVACTPSTDRRSWYPRHLALIIASAPMMLFLVIPMIALVAQAPLEEVIAYLTDQQVSMAIALSAYTTITTTCVTVALGTPLAYLMARYRFRGKKMLDTLIDLPLVLPPSAAGIALLLTFGRHGILGERLADLGLQIPFTPLAVVLAQTFVSAPFYIRATMNGIASVDSSLEEAGMVDGAGSLRLFWSITFPMARVAMISGAIMTWARALGEFGATIIFAGNFPGRTQTIPIAIYLGFNIDLESAVVLSAILLCVSFGVIMIVKWALKQSVTRAEIY
ncbi:NifC-like ABC-type porter [Thermobaculum terrenum ATCC BAA-798]|uniref:Molybdenum transport system permease n=2 Tax=Thermobaculum TaxID=262406 RepID=D1CBR2_THET1|nr:NifC-like ABC-type porter [Thermobaculum terrenum ATCC BAA-798]